MRRNSEGCRWCAWAAAVAVWGVGWFGFVHGEARPDQLRLRAQEAANRELVEAGFDWSALEIRGEAATLRGKAPSEEARSTLNALAPTLLARYRGVPGVYASLDLRLELMSPAEQATWRSSHGLPVAAPAQVGASAADSAAAPPAPQVDVRSTASAGSKPVIEAAKAPVPDAAPLAATHNVVPASAPSSRPGAANVAAATTLERPDPACQRELADRQRQQVLRFRAGSATLEVGQDDSLDGLAALLRRCPAGRVQVHGLREVHGAASNPDAQAAGGSLLLAQRRAQALRAELVARGLAPARVHLGAGPREVLGDDAARVEVTLAPGEKS